MVEPARATPCGSAGCRLTPHAPANELRSSAFAASCFGFVLGNATLKKEGEADQKNFIVKERVLCVYMVSSSTHYGSELKGQHVLLVGGKLFPTHIRLDVNICT